MWEEPKPKTAGIAGTVGIEGTVNKGTVKDEANKGVSLSAIDVKRKTKNH